MNCYLIAAKRWAEPMVIGIWFGKNKALMTCNRRTRTSAWATPTNWFTALALARVVVAAVEGVVVVAVAQSHGTAAEPVAHHS